LKLGIKIIAPLALVVIMVLGVISMSAPPSPLGSEEWPLPPEDYPMENLTSNLNVTNMTLFGAQPISTLGGGLDFPLGSQAFYYLGAIKNDTFLAFVVAKFPDISSSLRFGARVLETLKEGFPENATHYLVTNDGGLLTIKEANQTMSLWYGKGWLFLIQVTKGGEKGDEAVSEFKKAILRAYKG